MANSLMSKRKEIIYNAANKINIAVELLKQFPDRLAIIFSLTTPTSDKITELIGDSCVSFHSKLSKKQRAENFKRLNDGRTKVKRISAVKALNEGANIPKCSLIVIVSGTSKQKDFIQTIGRGIRFEEGKIAIIIRLYAKGTQEEQWVKSSQIGYITNTINSIEDVRLN
jgi:superfamily II DNA or RNA helicase